MSLWTGIAKAVGGAVVLVGGVVFAIVVPGGVPGRVIAGGIGIGIIVDGIKDIEDDKETWKNITQPKTEDHHDATDHNDASVADHYVIDSHHDVAIIESFSGLW